MTEKVAPLVVLNRADLEEMLERAVQAGLKMSTEPEWMTVEQVAELLGVQRDTVTTYTRREGLPCSRAGQRLMFRRDRVYAWLEERSQRDKARRASKAG